MSPLRHILSLPLLVLLATAGCDKTDDMPRLKDEALLAAARYQERIDDLDRRAQLLNQHASAVPRDAPGADRAQRAFMAAKTTIERSRNDLRQIPVRVQAGVKAGKPEELSRLIDGLRDQLDLAVQESTTQLSAVESWLAIAEQRPAAAAPGVQPAAAPAIDESQGSPAPTK